jgi:hypothetical protein
MSRSFQAPQISLSITGSTSLRSISLTVYPDAVDEIVIPTAVTTAHFISRTLSHTSKCTVATSRPCYRRHGCNRHVRPNVLLVAQRGREAAEEKDNAMSTKSLACQSIIRASGLALLAGIAVGAAQPAAAASVPGHTQSITQSAAVTSTDISAARRTRQARRTAPRDAYGSYVGGAGGVSPSYPGYGYGVGDNSRNQTW